MTSTADYDMLQHTRSWRRSRPLVMPRLDTKAVSKGTWTSSCAPLQKLISSDKTSFL